MEQQWGVGENKKRQRTGVQQQRKRAVGDLKREYQILD
jgi:hypothetical protein